MTEKSIWLDFLQESKIEQFNEWRMANISVKIDLSGMDFSGKDLSNVYLNGIKCVGANFSGSNLYKANFAQSEITDSKN
jgi:uncharacterized protein YjbI with pentapeptide repeats